MKYGKSRWCYKCGGQKMEKGGKRKVSQPEFNQALNNGYKPINSTTAVKNVLFENKLQAAAINMATQTQQQKTQYNQWLAQQMSSGKASPEYLAQQGYGSLQQLQAMYASLRPATDTVYYSPQTSSSLNTKNSASFTSNQNIVYDEGNIRAMLKPGEASDTLFFNPGFTPEQQFKAAKIYGSQSGRNVVIKQKGYTSPDVSKLERGGPFIPKYTMSQELNKYQGMSKKGSFIPSVGIKNIKSLRNRDQVPFFKEGGYNADKKIGESKYVNNKGVADFYTRSLEDIGTVNKSPFDYKKIPQPSLMGERLIKNQLTGEMHNVLPANQPIPNIINGVNIGAYAQAGISGLRQLSNFVENNRQNEYYYNNSANPLMFLPYDNMRSENVDMGYKQFKWGGKKMKRK